MLLIPGFVNLGYLGRRCAADGFAAPPVCAAPVLFRKEIDAV